MLIHSVKAFNKNTLSMIKILRTLRIQGYFHNTIRNIYHRHTANLMLDGEGMKAYSLWPGTG
jgi:hypothetical protein